MSEQRIPGLRLYLPALVLIAELAHLTWEYLNGGVISHHILARSDMPAISNWWGLVLLPVLAWLLAGRIHRRIALPSDGKTKVTALPLNVIFGFIGSLLLGVLLSFSFIHGYETITSYLFPGLLLLALLMPIYRAECVLGFILGMTFTFGAVLPTIFASIIATISAVTNLYIHPVILRLWIWLKSK